MKKRYFFTLILICIAHLASYAQAQILYKTVDTTQLYLTVYSSATKMPNKKPPAMVFFFGGGWNSGTVKQFEPQAIYFSQRGMTCILVDYRVKEKHKTSITLLLCEMFLYRIRIDLYQFS